MATPPAPDSSSDPQPRARPARCVRARRVLGRAFLLLLLLVIGAELVARFGFGLGNPPLYDRAPDIEYLYRPSRDYRYFHHDTRINAYSMRSPDFPRVKADPAELRIMILGDSIVAGGARVDQSELATSLLPNLLSSRLPRRVVVGNISAGSWGPQNLLAYARRFGLFQADVAIIVLNSGDVDDTIGLSPIGGAWPESRPPLAILEVARRGVERFAPGISRSLGLLDPAADVPPAAEREQIALSALRDLFAEVRALGARPVVVQHWCRSEIEARGGPQTGHARLHAAAAAADVPVVQLDEPFRQAAAAQPGGLADLYLPGDDVHLSAAGQRVLAETLAAAAAAALSNASGAPAP